MRPNSLRTAITVSCNRPRWSQIVDQGGEGQIELRAKVAFVIEVGVVETAAVRVHVPASLAEDRVEVVDRHIADAAFDQPPGHQTALAEGVAAIAVAHARRFKVEVEGFLGAARREQPEGALVRTVVRLRACDSVRRCSWSSCRSRSLRASSRLADMPAGTSRSATRKPARAGSAPRKKGS